MSRFEPCYRSLSAAPARGRYHVFVFDLRLTRFAGGSSLPAGRRTSEPET